MKYLWLIALAFALPMFLGCANQKPVETAHEFRSLYNEALNQINIAKTDPTADKAKIAKAEAGIKQFGPIIDRMEELAPLADKYPTSAAEFATLVWTNRHQLEFAIAEFALRRYIGF